MRDETAKQEMLKHIRMSIDFLEKALDVVESDDNFNDGQSENLNKIYDRTSKAIVELRNI